MQTAIMTLSILWIWFGLRQQAELTDPNASKFEKLMSVFLKTIYHKTDFKPLNCEFCLTIWVSICLSYWYNDLIFLSLPVIYKLIRTIERL